MLHWGPYFMKITRDTRKNSFCKILFFKKRGGGLKMKKGLGVGVGGVSLNWDQWVHSFYRMKIRKSTYCQNSMHTTWTHTHTHTHPDPHTNACTCTHTHTHTHTLSLIQKKPTNRMPNTCIIASKKCSCVNPDSVIFTDFSVYHFSAMLTWRWPWWKC